MISVVSIILRVMVAVAVLAVSAYVAGACYYWLGWPMALRQGGALLAVPLLCGLWFLPGDRRHIRQVLCAGLVVCFFAAYFSKSPTPQPWVALQERDASVSFDGNLVTITNFRNAVHPVGEAAEPQWETRTFDLDALQGAQMILQPFGPSAATVHVMTSYRFANDQYLVVSIEARRTSWDHFDPLAGFFRHDQIYVVLGSERDVLWQRLAHDPPNDLYFFDLTRPPAEIRAYLETLLRFADANRQEPVFYNTATESCFTTLLRLSPGFEQRVPWYDMRRWLPGDSVSLFQELELVDGSVSTDDLVVRGELQPGVDPPWFFPSEGSWSRHLRAHVGAVPPKSAD